MLKIQVPANIESLQPVNEFIAQALPEAFANILPQVELAAEELLVNIFSYAYANSDLSNPKHGQAEISCTVQEFGGEECFCLIISDWGNAFDPFMAVPPPDTSLSVEERPIGGYGVHLVKSVTKHYAYEYRNNCNIITLYFANS